MYNKPHIQELDRAPASTQLLSDTGLGAVVGQLSKLEDSLAPAGVIGYVTIGVGWLLVLWLL